MQQAWYCRKSKLTASLRKTGHIAMCKLASLTSNAQTNYIVAVNFSCCSHLQFSVQPSLQTSSQFTVDGLGFGISKSQNTVKQVHTNIAVKIALVYSTTLSLLLQCNSVILNTLFFIIECSVIMNVKIFPQLTMSTSNMFFQKIDGTLYSCSVQIRRTCMYAVPLKL